MANKYRCYCDEAPVWVHLELFKSDLLLLHLISSRANFLEIWVILFTGGANHPLRKTTSGLAQERTPRPRWSPLV